MVGLNMRILFKSWSLPNLKFHFTCFQSCCWLQVFVAAASFVKSISISLVYSLKLFFGINLKHNFPVFPGCGTTRNLYHVWCLFLYAFYVSPGVQLLRCGVLWEMLCWCTLHAFTISNSEIHFSCHHSYWLRVLFMRCYPNTAVVFE